MKVPPSELRQFLAYDEGTGRFTWIKRPRPGINIGRAAGVNSHKNGYRIVGFWGELYLAHRLAWWFVHSDLPFSRIDHINGNPDDNRIVNLRLCDQRQNNGNRRARVVGTSQYKGVRKHNKVNRWVAQITINKRCKYLGLFMNEADAAKAYDAAARAYFGTFARTNFGD